MFLSEWREFPSAPCLAGKKNLMTARVPMLSKSRASLTCFRTCFLPGPAKDLSAPRYFEENIYIQVLTLRSVPVKVKQTTINPTIANSEIYFLPIAYSILPYKLEYVTIYTTCSRFSNLYDYKNTCYLFNSIIYYLCLVNQKHVLPMKLASNNYM